MPKGDAYSIVYATAVCLVGSLLLAATSAGLRGRQEKMRELDRKFNVLKAFQEKVLDGEGRRIDGAAIERLYGEHVRERILDPATGQPLEGKTSRDYDARALEARQVLVLFEWEEGGAIAKYAFPVFGKGLWSTIYGYMALDRDLKKILGVSFYKHGETPGLGGEVEKDWFQEQFKDRPVFTDGKVKRIAVAKGKVLGERSLPDRELVDGISGATLTGSGVTRFLNADLGRYEAYFKGLRKD